MSIEVYLSFVAIAVIVIVVPGPNVTLILATSALRGIRAGLAALLVTTLAQVLQLAFVGLGLVWLVEAYSDIFDIIRYVGAIYLIYLGLQSWRSAGKPLPKPASNSQTARQGFFVGLANPKSLTFFAAFFPQFIDPAGSTEFQFTLLAASYALLALFIDAGYAIAGGMGNRFLATNRARLWLGRGSGLALIGGGALLAGTNKS